MFINKYKKSFISCVIIFYLLATLFLVLFCLRIMVSNAANSVIEGEKYSKIEPTSFLILGTDAAQTHAEGARSDVMMVATFNQSNSRGNMELNLISIPRDTIMKNTCSGEYEKANGIYNYGYQTSEVEGARCTSESISAFLNVPIDYYFTTSFNGLINLVNSIGGIEIDVPYDMTEQDSQGTKDAIVLSSGIQNLDGEETLAYARQRYSSSDYERNLRQQEILFALLSKILSDPISYLDDFLVVYQNDVTSNLDYDTVAEVSSSLINFYNNAMEDLSLSIPVIIDFKSSNAATTTNIGSGSDAVFGIDVNNIKNIPESTLYELSSNNLIENVVHTNTLVTPIYYSKHQTKFPSAFDDGTTNVIPIRLEINNYSILSQAINGDEGWYSYISPYILNYTSNVLRLSLGLESAWNNFDYSILSLYGGPTSYNIFYNDEMLYDVDLSQYYEEEIITDSIGDASQNPVIISSSDVTSEHQYLDLDTNEVTPPPEDEVISSPTPQTVVPETEIEARPLDSDLDGNVDAEDICESSDDYVDSDSDSIPDGCDEFPNNENGDSDGDGVLNTVDICVGDDYIDLDLDLVPDACDDEITIQ